MEMKRPPQFICLSLVVLINQKDTTVCFERKMQLSIKQLVDYIVQNLTRGNFKVDFEQFVNALFKDLKNSTSIYFCIYAAQA